MKLDDEHRAWLTAVIDPDGQITPDGLRYEAMARGEGAPKPYHYRWLLPRLLGTDRVRWRRVSWWSVLAMIPAMRLLTGKWSTGLFVLTADGVTGSARKYPVLVDAPAMLLAILTAAAARRRMWVTSVVLSLVAGATKETAPVFAACYAWNPVPLVGLLAPAVRSFTEPGPDVEGEGFSHACLTDPLWASWWARRDRAFDVKLWVAPWGGLLAGLKGDPKTAVTVAASYAQCVAAVDAERIYQWAWPVLAENTVQRGDDVWPLALVAGWFNPWKCSA